MIGIVVAAHGQLAAALVAAAEGIVGSLEQVATVDLQPSEGLEIGNERLEGAIRTVDQGQGVVLLVDLFGGTPSNCSMALLPERAVEVVTGFNLPMLLKLASSRSEGKDAATVARELVEHGRTHILHANALLHHQQRG